MLIDETKKNGLVFTEDRDYLADSVVCDYGIYERWKLAPDENVMI